MTKKNVAGSVTPEHDVRLTPFKCAIACAGLLQLRPGARVLEGSGGGGVWLDALFTTFGPNLEVHVNELRPECRELLEHKASRFGRWSVTIGRFEDYLTRHSGFDLVGFNPPYTYAEKHLRHSLYLCKPGGMVSYLLGTTFRGSQGRRSVYKDQRFGLWRRYMMEERPSFSEDGKTDATEYELFNWRRGYQGDEIVRSFSWKDADRYTQDRDLIRSLDWSE